MSMPNSSCGRCGRMLAVLLGMLLFSLISLLIILSKCRVWRMGLHSKHMRCGV